MAISTPINNHLAALGLIAICIFSVP